MGDSEGEVRITMLPAGASGGGHGDLPACLLLLRNRAEHRGPDLSLRLGGGHPAFPVHADRLGQGDVRCEVKHPS